MGHFSIGRYDDIVVKATQDSGLNSERLADLPLDAVALNGGSLGFHGDSETVMTQFVWNAENGALTQTIHLRLLKETTVFPRVMKAMVSAKGLRPWFRNRRKAYLLATVGTKRLRPRVRRLFKIF